MNSIPEFAASLKLLPQDLVPHYLRTNKDTVCRLVRKMVPSQQTITHGVVRGLFEHTVYPLSTAEVSLIFEMLTEKGYALNATILLFTGATKAR